MKKIYLVVLSVLVMACGTISSMDDNILSQASTETTPDQTPLAFDAPGSDTSDKSVSTLDDSAFQIDNLTKGAQGQDGGTIVSTGGKLEYLAGSARIDNGFVVITGEIVNHSSEWASPIILNVVLYGKSGNELLIDNTVTSAGSVSPGKSVPFKYLREVNKNIAEVAGFTISASTSVSDTKTLLDISQFSADKDDDGFYTVSGTVKNVGDTACEHPQIAIVGRTAENKIFNVFDIVVAVGNTPVDQIDAGDSYPIKSVFSGSNTIESVSVVGGCK